MRGSSLLDNITTSKVSEFSKAQIENLIGAKLVSPAKRNSRNFENTSKSELESPQLKLIPKNKILNKHKEDTFSILSCIDDAEKTLKDLNAKFEEGGDSDSIYSTSILE